MCNLPNMTDRDLQELSLDRTKKLKEAEDKMVKIVVPERQLLENSIQHI
jgi:hypothetical protein